MNYPLNLSFKLLALASQIYVRDANGNLIGYVKQKLLKLKEDINVCLLYTSPSPRDRTRSRMPSSA